MLAVLDQFISNRINHSIDEKENINAHHSYSFQSRYRLKFLCNIGYMEQEIKVTKLSEWKLKVNHFVNYSGKTRK